MKDQVEMGPFLAREYAVNAAIFIPATLLAFFTGGPADFSSAWPTIENLVRTLFVPLVLPGIVALFRYLKRTRNDKRINRQKAQIERLKQKLSAVKPQLDPMTQDEITRFLREFAGP